MEAASSDRKVARPLSRNCATRHRPNSPASKGQNAETPPPRDPAVPATVAGAPKATESESATKRPRGGYVMQTAWRARARADTVIAHGIGEID